MERTPAASQTRPATSTDAEDSAGEVARLIAAGKCKQAVELAKQEYKRCATLETEGRLVQAYLARIEQFQNKGMVEDAQTLVALVRGRFPRHRDRLGRLEVRSAAAGGRVPDLVAPLASGATPPEVRVSVETAVRQHLIDISGLVECDALPADHPLRVAAGAIWRAFGAVTAGPVTDEQIALPEVSHRSPLSGWKMLVRAIAAFYRHDDPGCKRALDAIPADAAVARLAPVLRAMMEKTPIRGGLAAALQAGVCGDDRPLRTALEGIESAFDWKDLSRLTRSIRDAVRACATSHPELYERLRQHISVACVLQDVPVDEVVRAMGSSRKDAYFWRLMARASERDGTPPLAALYWERFLQHAVAEGMIADRSLEAAMVYLHAAGVLGGMSLAGLGEARRVLGERNLFASYYRNQSPEIAALVPRSDKQIVRDVLSPGWLFERAAEIHPAADTFRQWWAWTQEVELPDRLQENVARRWHEKHPGHPQPLLNLSMLAERRDALKLALKHLSEAEAIDSLNPQVRQARVRLTLATTWRHFRDNKPHLVQMDLADLAALPGMGEGDRAAFLAALRAALHALRRDDVSAQQEISAVIEALGPMVGGVLLESVAQIARLPRDRAWPHSFGPALPDPHEVAHAEARGIRLSRELGLQCMRPAAWDPIINDVLREHNCPLAQAELLAIGEAAVRRPNFEQAYLASSAGLATANNPAAVARFLLIRAKSLKAPWAEQRSVQCLLAARELARQAHDTQLLQEVFVQIDCCPRAKRAIASAESGQELSDSVLAEVLKGERAALDFPRDCAEADRHLAIPETDRLGRGPFGALPFGGVDDDDGDDDEEADDFGPLNLPPSIGDLGPEARELLETLLDKKGRLPTPADLMNADPELLLRMLASLGGAGIDKEVVKKLLNETDDGPDDEPAGGFFGGFFRRRKRKQQKRR